MSDVPTMDRPRQRGRPPWLVYLSLARISHLPTVWTNCIAGVTLGHGTFGSDLIWLLIALSLMQLRPERPRARYGMLAAAILLIGFNTEWRAEPLVWSVLLAGLGLYSDHRHDSNLLKPMVMVLSHVMVYFVSAAVIGTVLDAQVFIGSATIAAYLAGLTYVVKQENLNEIQNLWPVALIALPLIHFFRGANLIVTILFVGWAIYALSFLIETPRRIANAAESLTAGISIVDALIISAVSAQNSLVFYAVGGFLVTLLFQNLPSPFGRGRREAPGEGSS